MAFKAKNYLYHNLPTFRLGMNSQQSPDEIHDEELADVENFSVEEDSLATAPGYSTYDDDIALHPGPYWGGVCFRKSDGAVHDVRQRQDILEWGDTGTVWTPCTLPIVGSPAATVSLTQMPCCFAQLNDTLLWTNGVDTVMSSTDGMTWELQPTLPICRVIFENAKNRVLFLGQTDSPFRLDWSGINDPLTINPAAYQLIDPNNNGMVIGAGLTPEGTTIIFKESGVYSISDYVDDGIIDVNYIGHTNISSHRTVQTTNNSVIWFGFDGLYEYIGGTIRNIFGKIALAGSSQAARRNDTLRGDLFCSAYYNNKYHLSIPDVTISDEYNGQEYIVYKNLGRDDPIQPYVVTRNKRYFGCYWIEDAEFDFGRDITLFVGDSRSESELAITGSPAVREDPIFAWVNDYREVDFVGLSVELGLAGKVQPAFFITKYFTENVPYFVKKYKKLFLNCKFSDTADIMIGYRFDPFSEFTMKKVPVETSQISWLYEDGNTGPFLEGYGFSQDSIANLFLDIENAEKPRGIQFKVMTNEIKDITNFGMSYKYQVKNKFK